MSAVSSKRRILMIDDDRKLCALVKDYLDSMGFVVDLRHSGPEGLKQALADSYEALILDVMMPGMDGIELLRELRKKSDVPVLMLTALGEESDRIVGLEIGADDYLPKTFSSRELLARLRAVTRRGQRMAEQNSTIDLVDGELRLNAAAHTVTLAAQMVDLTALEFALLHSLMRARGRVKTREALIEEVSDRRFDVFDRSIDVHISSLRKKLGDDPREPRFIRTIRGVGYILGDKPNA
jgi:two-component system response regulator CpxR